ncbi:acetolactate synthase large subunit [Dactylosporangium aurantiacum]|uniref:Acetolactate synthase n=1 Tax=Dactylosporangium aurantiacum TaxID=35754 RepID=A0A9Q9M9G8_9ACTN|nr:acetolactate synthase large subunit [Dactylosporangium aurantiacum]MDG6106914.1 acetolactate synthase large subunit [Dactylosporangium aurantiacum]UWZ50723.1 acetolactate synthase large subunit [Dactylosporangium aurantiacum]
MTHAEPITGAQALVAALERAGADTVFGIPGGAILPAYDPLYQSTAIRHVLVRHEQGAGHAATGYAQATGRVGVCMATSGPGATNLVTPLADAYLDSVPVVAITGQVPSGVLGTDAFQEVDICGMTLPITRHSLQVSDAAQIAPAIATAFRIATGGRPGPVLVDITKDALQGTTAFAWPPPPVPPGVRPVRPPDARAVRAAARLLTRASRPVLYVGGGVLKARAVQPLRELAELTGAPVTTTLMALGAFPGSHPLHLGMPGMHGSVPAVAALQRADLVIAIGARFDDRVTGRTDTFAPGATVVHIDIDPAEISKNVPAHIGIVGDAREVLTRLVPVLRAEHAAGRRGNYTRWWRQIDAWRARFPPGFDETGPGLAPQRVIRRIGELAAPGTVFTSGVGQHQMWAAQFLPHERPYTWLNSGGAGTMGYAVPAAMGAKAGLPDVPVWAIDGDGCFQMTGQELVTCAVNRLPIKVAVINNGTLGMVRQWQDLFYDRRFSHTTLHPGAGDGPGGRLPDFVRLAEAMGCHGLRCTYPEELDATIEKAMALDDAPVVVDFVVNQDAMVWPMVPAGTSNDDIMAARDVRPDFGDAGD